MGIVVKSTPAQLETYKRYYNKHPLRVKLKRVRQRAQRTGLEFDLEESDIVIPDVCPVLGIPITFRSKDYRGNASIDRIDSSKGYTKDNIRVISHRANILKSNATKEELELVLADARKLCLS